MREREARSKRRENVFEIKDNYSIERKIEKLKEEREGTLIEREEDV